jgi:hypothetical protein
LNFKCCPSCGIFRIKIPLNASRSVQCTVSGSEGLMDSHFSFEGTDIFRYRYFVINLWTNVVVILTGEKISENYPVSSTVVLDILGELL